MLSDFVIVVEASGRAAGDKDIMEDTCTHVCASESANCAGGIHTLEGSAKSETTFGQRNRGFAFKSGRNVLSIWSETLTVNFNAERPVHQRETCVSRVEAAEMG